MSYPETYEAVRACSLVFLAGGVLQIGDVSAGRGTVIDWRSVKSGETLQTDSDACETAQLFVALVGPDDALSAALGEPSGPRIVEYMQASNGGRRRSFQAGGFTVMVEPHEDDDAQADFTRRLAVLVAS